MTLIHCVMMAKFRHYVILTFSSRACSAICYLSRGMLFLARRDRRDPSSTYLHGHRLQVIWFHLRRMRRSGMRDGVVVCVHSPLRLATLRSHRVVWDWRETYSAGFSRQNRTIILFLVRLATPKVQLNTGQGTGDNDNYIRSHFELIRPWLHHQSPRGTTDNNKRQHRHASIDAGRFTPTVCIDNIQRRLLPTTPGQFVSCSFFVCCSSRAAIAVMFSVFIITLDS